MINRILLLFAVLFGQPIFACEWRSERDPDVMIRMTDTRMSIAPIFRGSIQLKGRRVLPFAYGRYEGYAQWWWEIEESGEEGIRRTLINFRGNEPVHAAPKNIDMKGERRVLTVDMGRAIWYGAVSKQSFERSDLLSAAEGFWQVSDDCAMPR